MGGVGGVYEWLCVNNVHGALANGVLLSHSDTVTLLSGQYATPNLTVNHDSTNVPAAHRTFSAHSSSAHSPPLHNPTDMTRWTCRTIHATLALPIIAPLLLTIVTGFAYRFARNALQVDKSYVQWLLSVHSMSILGLGGVYPLLVAGAVLAAAVTGVPLSSVGTVWRRWMAGHRADLLDGVVGLPAAFTPRVVHRAVTATVALPLVVTALTGAVWTVQQSYLGHTRQQSGYLMGLHQGSFTGSTVAYTGGVFACTLLALMTGYTLTSPSERSSGAVRVAPKVPPFFKDATKQ